VNYLKPSDLTVAQRSNLVRFVKRYRAETDGIGDGVRDKDFGSISGLNHLIRKGALKVVREEIGPRGGKTRILAATPEGLRVADYIVVNRLKTW
jgi:hypothetical protein